MSDSIKRNAIFIEGNRNGYGPDQVEHRTLTVAELIDMLTELGDAYGMDAKVFLRNDNGYTYGSIGYDDAQFGQYDDDRVWMGYADEYDEEW